MGQIELAPALQPSVPAADDRTAASAVLSSVLDVTDLSGELQNIACRYVDDAPRSAAHVLDLQGALARTVLDWIGRWPA
jgi:hypothetical protein